jgi:hypothetical protein
MPTTVNSKIGEHDVVALTDTITKAENTGTWPAGTKGAVISDFGDHKMVDIANEQGETLDMPIIAVEKLELVSKHS